MKFIIKIFSLFVLLLLFSACGSSSKELVLLADSKGVIAENATVGTVVGNINIVSSNENNIDGMLLSGEGSELFAVDKYGLVTLKSRKTLDYETMNFYNLSVVAIVEAGYSNRVSLDISVIDIPLNPFKIAEIYADDGGNYNLFGTSISSYEDYIVVGTARAHEIYLYQKESDDSVTLLSKIIPNDVDDYKTFDNFGCGVSIYENYIAVGSYKDNDENGSLYLFKLEDNGTTHQTAKAQISGTLKGIFDAKCRVDMYEDYIAVGTQKGVNIFKKDATDTLLEIKKLDSQENDEFGFSLSLEKEYLVVGAPDSDLGGRVSIFKIYSDSNISKISEITVDDSGGWFGKSVDIYEDYISISTHTTRSLYIYKKYSDDNISQIFQIASGNTGLNYELGWGISMFKNRVASSDIHGNTTIFEIYSDTNITQIASIGIENTESTGISGETINMNADHVVISAMYKDIIKPDAGSVYVYNLEPLNQIYLYNNEPTKFSVDEGTKSNIYSVNAYSPNGLITYVLDGEDQSTMQLSENNLSFITPPDYEEPIDIGADNNYHVNILMSDDTGNKQDIDIDVSINDKYFINTDKVNVPTDSISIYENYIIVGSSSEEKAYLYKKEAGIVTQVVEIKASDAIAGEKFGSSVEIEGDYIFVGAPGINSESKSYGSVYVFKKDSNENISQIARVEVDDEVNPDDSLYDFGRAISFSGNYLAVGSKYYENCVYLFKKDVSDTFMQIAKLKPEENRNSFGSTVSIYGDYIAVGASRSTTEVGRVGSLFVFKRYSDSNITLLQKIEASDSKNADYFGTSVSQYEDYIVVGAKGSDTNLSNTGSAYIFKRAHDDSFDQIVKLMPDELESDDKFGTLVSISEDYIAVSTGSMNGSVYMFEKDNDGDIRQIDKMEVVDMLENNRFGNSFSLYEDELAITNNDYTTNKSSFYLYKKDENQAQ